MQLVRTGTRGGGQRAASWLGAGLASLFALASTALPGSAATLDRARETGSLKLGFVADARPYSYRDESGSPAGYAVELCQAVADAVKQELGLSQLRAEFVPLGFDERFDALKQGKVDVLCAAGTATLARREQVDFSIPVFPGGVGALMRKDAPERMREILAGRPEPYRPRWRASLGQILAQRTFAVGAGTTTEAWLRDRLDEFAINARIETVSDLATGLERVVSRKADVLFAEREILLDAARRSADADDLMVLDRHFTYEPFALALQRGDEDFRLAVDRALSRLYRSAALPSIYAGSFGPPDDEALRFFRMSALPE